MTTLKQILQKHCDMPTYYRYLNEINAIKEWLRQKHKELPKYTHRDVTLFIVNLIKDLNSDNND